MRIRSWTLVIGLSLLCAVGIARADDKQLFSRIDANSDGQISSDEVQAEGKPLYSRLLRVADKNRDGKLSKEELDAGLKPSSEKFEMSSGAMMGGPPGGAAGGRPGGDMAQSAQQMLANIDRDKNGKISESEAPPRLKANFKQLDKDGDGELDRREMGAAMMQMRPVTERPGAGRPNAGKPKSEQSKSDKPRAGDGKRSDKPRK